MSWDILLDLHHGASLESNQTLMRQRVRDWDFPVGMSDELCLGIFWGCHGTLRVHANLFKNAVQGLKWQILTIQAIQFRYFKQENLALRALWYGSIVCWIIMRRQRIPGLIQEILKGLLRQLGLVVRWSALPPEGKVDVSRLWAFRHDSLPKSCGGRWPGRNSLQLWT